MDPCKRHIVCVEILSIAQEYNANTYWITKSNRWLIKMLSWMSMCPQLAGPQTEVHGLRNLHCECACTVITRHALVID